MNLLGRAERRVTAAMALVGVLAGHGLAYLFVDPHDALRAAHLESTGHGWLGLGASATLVLGVMATGAFVASRLRPGMLDGALASVRHLTLILAVSQVAIFLGIEVVERLFAGAPLTDLVGSPLGSIGVAVQVAVAIVAARAMRTLERASAAARGLARVGMLRPSGRVRTGAWTRDAWADLRHWSLTVPARAPPRA